MPVRTVSNRGRRNVIGYFPSLKMHRMVQFESTLERDLIYLLDFDRQVTAFEEQPLKITYQYGGKTLTYTPDFQMETTSGRIMLLECKPTCFAGREENQRKFDAAQTWCAAQGWGFQVVTDEQLRIGHLVQNVKLLTQHARYEVEGQVKGKIIAFLSAAYQPVTIGDLLEAVNPDDPTTAVIPILHMTYHHQLQVSLINAPLNAQTPIHLYCPAVKKGENNEHHTLLNW